MSDRPADEQRGEQAGGGSRAAPAPWLEKHRFQPGQSGNPGGRPKGRIDLSRRIERELLRAVDEDHTFADALAKRIVRSLLDDPVKAQRLILAIQDRDEGPVQRDGPVVEFNMGGGAPEVPPLEGSGKGGAPPLREHLQRLVSIAAQRGLVDLGSIVGEVVEDAEVEMVDREG